MTLEDIQSGQTFLVKKPVDWTSFDVVNKIRFAIRNHFKIKKIKVGHAGTLDPFATGLLILCTGKHTKTIDSIVGQEKEYRAIFYLGSKSNTYDSTGEIEVVSKEIPPFSDIEALVQSKFIGKIKQKAPMFSAKKVDGTRLYHFARKGIEVEREEKEIEIKRYDLLSFEKNRLALRIVCSKGSYIRSLAHDLGELLGCGAYCEKLERSRIGDFLLEDALSIDECIDKISAST